MQTSTLCLFPAVWYFPMPYSRALFPKTQQSGTAEYRSNCLVIYVTLNISQGDPEVRFVPKPAQCLGRVTF